MADLAVGCDSFDGFAHFHGFIRSNTIIVPPRPDAKRTTSQSKLPCAGDSIAIARARVCNVVRSNVGLDPAASAGHLIVAAVDEKAAYIVHSVAGKNAA